MDNLLRVKPKLRTLDNNTQIMENETKREWITQQDRFVWALVRHGGVATREEVMKSASLNTFEVSDAARQLRNRQLVSKKIEKKDGKIIRKYFLERSEQRRIDKLLEKVDRLGGIEVGN